MADRDELEAFYRRYNACCNAHEFDRLGEFVAPDVRVDGEMKGLPAYARELAGWVEAFPDFRWEVQRLFVDGSWLSAHFIDTGTHAGPFLDVPATGRSVRTQEFAVYRFDADRIVEVWGTVDSLGLLRQLS